MGGKSSDSGSREMIQMQKAEAADARAREAARQERINSGLTRIRQAFEGAPVMATRGKNFDWASAAPGAGGAGTAALPQGYGWVNVGGGGGGGVNAMPPPEARAPTGQVTTKQKYVGGKDASQPRGFQQEYAGKDKSGSPLISSFGQFAQLVNPTAAGGGAEWAIRGPDGRVYRRGEQIPYFEQYDTGGRTGGIGEDFYNKFRTGILNTQLPQLAEQYGKASDETKFRHARAGTTESTAKVRNIADLVKQNTIADASIRQKADTAAGDLRNRVNKERAAAEAQLYSTENPDVAATYATNAIRNISAEQPDTSPLADAFTLAAIGGANLFSGVQNASQTAKTRDALRGYGATRTV